MSDAVITVENLSKRYLLGHRSGERGHNTCATLSRARLAPLRRRQLTCFKRGRSFKVTRSRSSGRSRMAACESA